MNMIIALLPVKEAMLFFQHCLNQGGQIPAHPYCKALQNQRKVRCHQNTDCSIWYQGSGQWAPYLRCTAGILN